MRERLFLFFGRRTARDKRNSPSYKHSNLENLLFPPSRTRNFPLAGTTRGHTSLCPRARPRGYSAPESTRFARVLFCKRCAVFCWTNALAAPSVGRSDRPRRGRPHHPSRRPRRKRPTRARPARTSRGSKKKGARAFLVGNAQAPDLTTVRADATDQSRETPIPGSSTIRAERPRRTPSRQSSPCPTP